MTNYFIKIRYLNFNIQITSKILFSKLIRLKMYQNVMFLVYFTRFQSLKKKTKKFLSVVSVNYLT